MAMIGIGCTLGYSDTQSGIFTTLAAMMDLEMPEIKLNDVKTTAHDTPDYTHTFQPGMIDPGELSAKIHFAKAVQDALYTLMLNRSVKWWRVEFPKTSGESTGSNFKGQGFVSSLKDTPPIDDNLLMEIKIKLSGKVTFTQGS